MLEIGAVYYQESNDRVLLAVSNELLVSYVDGEWKEFRIEHWDLDKLREAPVALLKMRWGVDWEDLDQLAHLYLKPQDYRDMSKKPADGKKRDLNEEASVFSLLRLYRINRGG